MTKFIAVREYKALESTLVKLSSAATDRDESLQDEKEGHADEPWPGIDNAPLCFEYSHYCQRALDTLRGIRLPIDRRKVTEDEASDIQEQLDDVRSLLEESGVDTERVLFPKKRSYMRRPPQARLGG